MNSLSKLLMIAAIAILATGCNTMTASNGSIKYGKLYTMQETLNEVVANCDDAATRNRALDWAVIGYSDLNNSREFMERSSEAYIETRNLMRTLSLISARRNHDTEMLCERFEMAAKASQHFLANIETMSRDAVIVAAVKY